MCNGGRVLFAGPRGNYGNMVDIQCPARPDGSPGPILRYAHLNDINVSVGQEVDVNTNLGGVGSTGNSSGDHLHFEVIQGGNTVDPLNCVDIGAPAGGAAWACVPPSQPTGASNPDGTPECKDANGNVVPAQYQSATGGDDFHCNYCSAAITMDDRSWATDIFVLLFRTTNNLTTAIYGPVSTQSARILYGAALLYIVWTLLMAIMTGALPGGGVSADYFSNIIVFLFKVGVCAVILKYGREAFSLLIEPIIRVSAEISERIVRSGNDIVFPSVSLAPGSAPNPTFGQVPVQDLFMNEAILQSFLNILQAVYNEVQKGWNLALTMICVGMNPQDSFRIFGIPTFKKYDFVLVGTGGMLLGSYALLAIFYPIYLMDAFLRLMFVICFFPIFALLWVFKITSDYVKKAFAVLMSACMTFIFSAVIVKIVLTLYASALDMQNGPLRAFFEACLANDLNIELLAQLINEVDGFSALVTTVLVGVVGWFAMQKAESYAVEFAQAGKAGKMTGIATGIVQEETHRALGIARRPGEWGDDRASRWGDQSQRWPRT